MHVKYFQPLADIKYHYDEVIKGLNRSSKYADMLLATWGVKPEDESHILEEYEVLRYLLACQHMFAFDANVYKPPIYVVERLFNRHLGFLETVRDCHAYNVNKHSSKRTQKEYKACRHYLFKFSLPAWYQKMPDVVLTYQNKWVKEL
jgi:hypothetical protein